jgi:hypothetical protein
LVLTHNDSGIFGYVTDTVDANEAAARAAWVSPVFGDIVAKMTLAAELEVERLLGLGVPIVVDRGNGIEELTTWPSR